MKNFIIPLLVVLMSANSANAQPDTEPVGVGSLLKIVGPVAQFEFENSTTNIWSPDGIKLPPIMIHAHGGAGYRNYAQARVSIFRDEEFETINTREDVTISFIKNTPINGIEAAVVLFAGGDGDIGIDIKYKTVGSDNFLVRSRGLFAKYGLLVITPDLPSDMDSVKNDRGNTDYRTDISFLIKEIRKQTTKPIWLIGTSRGSITVGYHAAALDIQGIALTATVTDGNHDTVFSADLEKIKVPALIVHHENDQCWSSPAEGAKGLMAALINSPKKNLLLFRKGESGNSEDCGPISPHGFLGIENRVVGAMSGWMLQAIGENSPN